MIANFAECHKINIVVMWENAIFLAMFLEIFKSEMS